MLIDEILKTKMMADEFSEKDSMIYLNVYRTSIGKYKRFFTLEKSGLMGAMVNAASAYLEEELKRLQKNFEEL